MSVAHYVPIARAPRIKESLIRFCCSGNDTGRGGAVGVAALLEHGAHGLVLGTKGQVPGRLSVPVLGHGQLRLDRLVLAGRLQQ